jgi:hypothetical protein
LKLGTENRKEVIVLVVVGVIVLVQAGRVFWPSAPPETAPASATSSPSGFTRVSARRTATGRVAKPAEPRLDPTLQLDLLPQSEGTQYAGMGRNIFVTGSLPIEKPLANGTPEVKTYTPPPIPPPPPINLKFFGFASRPGEPKKVFLSQGEDIFIGGEGDIVDRRYRILRILPASVDVEDVLNNNRQSIPLTQG